ncbi:MAG: hypothetical protein SFZ24_06615 [Planctomycetota bacterium]|nr:hypothetical protein [Planctomycetota bacterium]
MKSAGGLRAVAAVVVSLSAWMCAPARGEVIALRAGFSAWASVPGGAVDFSMIGGRVVGFSQARGGFQRESVSEVDARSLTGAFVNPVNSLEASAFFSDGRSLINVPTPGSAVLGGAAMVVLLTWRRR